ncbi:MAG: hypothetical protein JNL32_06410 [Candidatus Kapabacteria bacterium]|nr:hypothetical protein [Candidatus Kapabacteria bacterium]
MAVGTVLINAGGFIVTIPCTVASSGADKGKVTAFGTVKPHTYVGVCKPTYKSQEASAAEGENVEITTGSGITLTAPKKVKKVSLVGAVDSASSSVTDEYELIIIDDTVVALNYYRAMEKAGNVAVFLVGIGYDQNNADSGFEAIQGKVTEVSRSTAANGENVLTVKIKGSQTVWKSTVTHSSLNTAVATTGSTGVITPVGETEINLVTGRLFTADDVTALQNGQIVPKP